MISAFGINHGGEHVSKVRFAAGQPMKIGEAAAKLGRKLRPVTDRPTAPSGGMQAFIRKPRKDKA